MIGIKLFSYQKYIDQYQLFKSLPFRDTGSGLTLEMSRQAGLNSIIIIFQVVSSKIKVNIILNSKIRISNQGTCKNKLFLALISSKKGVS